MTNVCDCCGERPKHQNEDYCETCLLDASGGAQ